MTGVRVLSAGAAKGLVGKVGAEFTAATGHSVDGVFSAVGAIRERFEGGAPCDVLILTATQLAELEAAGRVRTGSVTPIGAVHTAVAVLNGRPAPDVSTSTALAASLRAASALFMPDPYRSTAGIHVRRVLETLGLADDMAPKLRVFPNGETAMRTLVETAPAGSIGITQATEILYTEGLSLVAKLPQPHGLSTVYAACVNALAELPDVASSLTARLTGPETMDLRRRMGFE